MGLLTKLGKGVPVGDEALAWAKHQGDLETGTYVGWVTYHQPAILNIAKRIGYTPSDERSQPFGVQVYWDPQGPKGGAFKVDAGGKILGYTSTADGPHKQTGKRVARLFRGVDGVACLLLDP